MRMPAASLVTLIALVALPAPASATTVTQTPGGKVDGQRVDVVRVKAALGEMNDVMVSVRLDRSSGMTITTVRDAGAGITNAAGCARSAAREVRCETANDLGMVDVVLRDGDDSATVASRPRDYRLYYVTMLDGGRGDDDLRAGDGAESMDGGAGDDRLRGSGGYESMNGGHGNDALFGRGAGDFLEGGPGDDILNGGRGNDDLLGGLLDPRRTRPGADRLYGGPGRDNLDDSDVDPDAGSPDVGPDVLDGGGGEDTVDSYRWRSAPVTVDLREQGGAGEAGEGDSLHGFESVIGGAGDDALTGDDGPNWLDGRGGTDAVRGLGGDDLIFAWDADAVTGDAGNDDIRTVPEFEGTLACGPGDDVVRLDVFLEKPAGLVGPSIEDACERLTNGSTFSIDPVPEFGLDGAMTFAVIKNRRDGLRLVLSAPVAPFAEIGSAPIDTDSVAFPASDEPALRALVSPLGSAPFAWVFTNG